MIKTALAATMMSAIALPSAAQDMRPVQMDGTVLEVSANGSSTRVPDMAVIQAGVISQAATASAAMTESSSRMRGVLAALTKAGIAARDIQTSSVSLNPQYRHEDNKPPILVGYQASNQVSVRFRDVGKSGAILDTLVAQGANNISGPNLTVDKPESALDEARQAAIRAARARADLYANATGLKVDRILAISESGGFPAPVPMMAYARGDMVNETKIMAGEQEITVTVNVRFLLK